MANPITLLVDRRVDGELEEVATFVFSDFAEIAAAAIVERYGWPVVVQNVQDNGDFSARFEMGTKEVPAVVKT